ncbi:hypothetical protein D3C81_2194320 [compost metagenome]
MQGNNSFIDWPQCNIAIGRWEPVEAVPVALTTPVIDDGMQSDIRFDLHQV